MLVATECGYWKCDVLGANDSEVVEIETKISKSDLQADGLKHKHKLYNCESNWTPNRVYFLVPENLEDAALQVAESINPRYGVMVANEFGSRGYKAHEHMSVKRRAQPLHNRTPTESFKNDIIARMSSEIVGWHIHDWGERTSILIAKNLAKIQDMETPL